MSRTPVLAPSLVQLRREIDLRWPGRSKASDGWIGDTAHQARRSEHNPDPDGIVRAIDVTAAGIDVKTVLDATIRDSRVHYVIHARQIWSRSHGWKKRPYTGSNPHTTHIHISIRNATSERASAATRAAAAADTRPWIAPVDTRTDIERTLDNMDEKQLRKIIREEAQRAVAAELWTPVIDPKDKRAPALLQSSWRNNLWHLQQKVDRIIRKIGA